MRLAKMPIGGPGVAEETVNISPLFALLTLVLVLVVVLSLVLVRLRINLLVGYLLSGMLIGNVGLLGFTGAAHGDAVISQFAEIGVILLMFTLGVEFPISEHRHLWRISLFGGLMQVGLTAGLASLLASALGFPAADSAIMGIAVALSSTAVAMKSFQDLGQQNNPGARASLGIALFQDVLVILVFLIMPVIYRPSREGPGLGMEIGSALIKGVAFLAGAWLFGQYGITPLLHAVARTRSRELFTLTVIGLCAGVAFAGSSLDLSLALGAFAAGLVVSESIYSHRILSEILPFKDLFLALFFVSVGLLIDLSVVVSAWPGVVFGALAILAAKGLIAFLVLKTFQLPGRAAILSAGSLASTGEFSLVLIGKAGGFRPFDPATEQALLACTAVTMAAVPTLMRSMIPLGKWLETKGLFSPHKATPEVLTPTRVIKDLRDHAIICGYGPVGRALNEALKRCGVETLVVELNSETVRTLKKSGQPVLFADATHPEALDLAGIQRARLVAFTFPEVKSTCAAVPLVRERNPEIVMFGRAKYRSEAIRLRELDVQVVHDEQECAVSMIRAAMTCYERADIDPSEAVGSAMENWQNAAIPGNDR